MAVELIPMTPEAFEAYLDFTIPIYAAEKVQAGNFNKENSLEQARQEFKTILPDGLDTPDHYMFCVYDGDVEVGYFWIWERTQDVKKTIWIYDIVIHEDYRRKGYAMATFEALEEFMRENLTARRIGLHVFGHNHGAQALYQKLGFEITNIIMAKDIEA